MVLSGFAGLGYQIVWTQESALWLGHESAAVFAVVAAFFGGMGLGAWILGSRIDRSAKPVRWYAVCEMTIGLWGLALSLLLAPVTGWLLDLIGAQPSPVWQWSVAFCGVFLLLLPATAAMGATLPAMERVLSEMSRERTTIAVLYAGNTLGAVIGVLAAAFWLVPELGLVRTAGVCSALNLICAIVAAMFFASSDDVSARLRSTDTAAEPSREARRTMRALAVTGLLGIGYEVVVVRVLSQVAENTVYTFAILLAVYLVGTALGAAAYGLWFSRRGEPERLRDALLRALAMACSLGALGLAGATAIKAATIDFFGINMAAALAGEAALAAVAFLLPTLIMGALFSHLSTHARAAGIGFGRALGINTLGAATAPLIFAMVLAPLVGAKLTLALIAVGYLVLSSRRAWSSPVQWGAVSIGTALIVWAPSLAIVDVPEGGRLVSYLEGPLGVVGVVEDAGGVSSLHIDNRQQEGSSATLLADARQALLPILLHPSPRRALFLGLGTGITAASAAEDPQLQVDAVELVPQVIEASAFFTRALNGGVPNPRLHLMAADARRFVRVADERYDVIVSDNFHPARSGSGALYTVEHFKAVHERLAPGGLFCQWLPLHQLDLESLRSIVRTFMAEYPRGWALLATNSLDTPVVGLIARSDGKSFDVEQLRKRLLQATMPHGPAEFGIVDDLALLGNFIAGPRALARFASDAPVNTDDRPVVAYRAPRITYVPDSLPRERLLGLLHAVRIDPDELLDAPFEAAWGARLSAYWTARNAFIEAGREVRPTSDVRRMLAQVREPLLAVLRMSPDFRPAYDPLLLMAEALVPIDAAAARELLSELQRVRPVGADAARVLSGIAN